MTRPLSEVLADERAWTAATDEVIAAARKAEREACAALVPQKKPEQDDPALPA